MAYRTLATTRVCPIVLAVVALVLGACGDDDDEPDGAAGTTITTEAPATTVDETTTTAEGGEDVELTQSCTNERDGYSLRYPEGWATNTGDVEPPCRFFSPGEVSVEEGTEPDTAVIADVENVAFDRATDEDRTREIINEREATIAGRNAVRIEQRHTGEGLHPEGTLSTVWYVDLGDEQTFIASAREADGASYEQAVTALDAMIETLDITTG